MAAPEAEHPAAGLTVPQLTPSVYHPQYVNVPTGAGELWAQVGKNLMAGADQVFKTLMESPLNPAVKAQMDYTRKGLAAGSDIIEQARQKGYAPYLMRATPQGIQMIAPGEVTDPTMAARLAEMLKNPAAKTPASGPAPTVAPRTGTDQDNTPPTAPKPPTTKEMGTTQAAPLSTNLFASYGGAQPPAAPDMMYNAMYGSGYAQRGGFVTPQGVVYMQGGGPAPTGAGMPPGFFLNPATGNVERLQQPVPAQAQQQQPPAQVQPPVPMRPPVPVAPAQQPLAQALNPMAQQTQPNWGQGPGAAVVGATQSLHPVMSSQTALDLAKSFDTSAQRAVYLPQGPTGEPAFSFYGPKNKPLGAPVPISTLVRHGGAGLAAGENLGSVLNTADQKNAADAQAIQQQNQPQPQTNQPGNMLLQAPQQPPAGAPAAPGQGPLLASTAYDPTAYRQAIAQAVQDPRNLMAQTAAGGQPAQQTGPNGQPLDQNNNPVIQATGPGSQVLAPANISQADQDAAQAKFNALSPDQKAQLPKDPVTGDRRVSGPNDVYNWYVDDDPKSTSRGRLYNTLPGTAGSYWDQQRFYLGSRGYQLYELPDSSMKQKMEYWIQRGDLSRQQVSTMSPGEMKPWLAQLWRNENLTKGPIDGPTDKTLNVFSEYHNAIQQIRDIQQTLLKHHVDVNQLAQLQAVASQAAQSWGMKLEPEWEDPKNALNAYSTAINRARLLQKDFNSVLGSAMETGATSPYQIPKLPIYTRMGAVGETPAIGIPPEDLLGQAWSGRDPHEIARNFAGLQQYVDNWYKYMIGNAQAQWKNIDPRHQGNMLNIDQGQRLKDPLNHYTSQEYPPYEISDWNKGKDELKEHGYKEGENRPFIYKGKTYYF